MTPLQLTPTQAAFLLNPRNVSPLFLIKLALKELILSGHLQMNTVRRRSNNKDTQLRKYTLLVKGENFRPATAAHHQKPLLAPFENRDIELQVRFLAKKMLKDYSNPKGFKTRTVYDSCISQDLFKKSFGLNRFGYYPLTEKGTELKTQLQSSMKDCNNLLGKVEKTTLEDLQKTVNTVGLNLLLLEEFDIYKKEYFLEQHSMIASIVHPNISNFSNGLKNYLEHAYFFEYNFDNFYKNFGFIRPKNDDDEGLIDIDFNY